MNDDIKITQHETTQPLYTPQQIVDHTISNIKEQISDYEREQIVIQGKIAALENIMGNMNYMINQSK
jgi:hypothetical protein